MTDESLLFRIAQHIQSADYAQARQALETQLRSHAGDGRALDLLCKLADRSGDYSHAADWLCRSLEMDAQNHRAYCFLGYVMCKLGQFEAGVECYGKAIALDPSQPAYFCESAAALAELGRHDQAVAAYEQALALDPSYADAHAHLGTSLFSLGRTELAIARFSQAIALDTRCVSAFLNRGNAYLQKQQFENALADYDQAIALHPGHALAHANRAAVLKQLHRLDDSLQSSDLSIALDPQYVDAQFNKSLTQLLRGDLIEGFRGYQVRWKTPTFAPIRRQFTQPLWLGDSPLEGKRLLVHNEQGLGDSLQFCRFVTLAARAGAEVIYEVEAPLYDLFQSLEGVTTLIRQRDPLPAFDLYCPVMSLPIGFACSLSNLPAQSAYLHAKPEKLAQWAALLGPRQVPRIGLVWSGNATHKADQQRSIALEDLLRALVPGLQYFSLQKELRDADAQALARAPQLHHFGQALADFSDTAALCAHMDLVIAVDTSVAHLAGALGVRTCLLLPRLPDWRWLLSREDSPWYPSMRLLRQKQACDWRPVFDQVRQCLASLQG
jgi:tetratricopeptide (TPR) repeat protein